MSRRTLSRLAWAAILVACVTALSLVGSTSAAGMTVSQQRMAGPYRLVLRIGPPEKMEMHATGGGGEMMLGGKQATCRMGGMAMGMNGKTCNRHVELHVYTARTNRVVMHAGVRIVLRDTRMHMSIVVPIMTMSGMGMGMSDYHYGNNIYAAAGSYSVFVTVNRVSATFLVRLM